jgi:protein gp37
MAEKSKISWCDSTLNFWEGCTKVSPGCANCYAEARDKRFTGGKLWGPGATRRKSKSAVKEALRLNAKPWLCDECEKSFAYPECDAPACTKCLKPLRRRRIFSLSLGDWLDPEVPIEWLAEMLDTIRRCNQVELILCTKRPELFRERLEAAMEPAALPGRSKWVADWLTGNPPANITILASVEDQATADARIPALLRIPASRRGLSLEPLLGLVDLYPWINVNGNTPAQLDWLIIGGESGPKARPCNVDWIRSLVNQGNTAGVPVFVKQASGPKSGMQGDIPDEIFNVQQFPFVS